MSFLGEKLLVTSQYTPKIALELIVSRIVEILPKNKDTWFEDIQKECQVLFDQYKEREKKLQSIDFEEDLKQLDRENNLQVLTWFVLWLGKVYIKPGFLTEMCIVFAKIWKVLDETQLSIQDLDNKLVWKKVTKECEKDMPQLETFKNDQNLIYEFVQKTCQLIGKAFESETDL